MNLTKELLKALTTQIESFSKKLIELKRNNPNDADLGKQVRTLIKKIQNT